MKAPAPLNPDRAVLTQAGRKRELSIEQFFAIPLEKQLEHLFKGEVSFLQAGKPVRTLDALKVLRAQRARTATAS